MAFTYLQWELTFNLDDYDNDRNHPPQTQRGNLPGFTTSHEAEQGQTCTNELFAVGVNCVVGRKLGIPDFLPHFCDNKIGRMPLLFVAWRFCPPVQ
jgi:hypothetical protein